MKVVRKIISIFFVIVLFLMVLGIILAHIYEDKIIGVLIEKLNNHLRTEIVVDKENVNLSFIKRFPYATIEFSDILAKSTHNLNSDDFLYSTDTLFYTKKLFLKLNIIKLLHNEYTVDEVHLKRGKINTFIDTKGNTNYRFWDIAGKNEEKGLSINLRNIRLTDCHWLYDNKKGGGYLKSFVQKSNIGGSFSRELSNFQTNAILYLYEVKNQTNTLLVSKNAIITMQVMVQDSLITLKGGSLNIENMSFLVSGNLIRRDNLSANLKLSGQDLDVTSFISLLPDKYKNRLHNYSSEGKFYFNSTLVGDLGINKNPFFEAYFGIENGTILRKNTSLEFTDVSLKGYYRAKSIKKPGYLQLEDFYGKMGSSSYGGQLEVNNLDQPQFSFSMNTSINLEELHDYFTIDTLKYLRGLVTGDLSIKGNLKNRKVITKRDIVSFQSHGSLEFKDVSFQVVGKKRKIENASGSIFLDDGITLKDLQLKTAGNTFMGGGNILNLFEFVLLKEDLVITNANVISDDFVLDSLVGMPEKQKQLMLPAPLKKLYLQGQFQFPKFRYKDFHATNMSGSLRLTPTSLSVYSFKCNALQGSVSGETFINQKPNNEFDIRTHLSLSHIEIQKTFITFHNFNQDVLKSDNIKGTLIGEITFSGKWDDNHKLIKESILSEVSILIKNGELIQFEPMYNLSKFCKVEELEHIRFSNLENEIIIKDGMVVIPQMDISSNAFNISGSGIHNFDKSYEYKIQILLSEILSNKVKKAKKENEQFMVYEDDDERHASLYLTITGKGNEYKVVYDRKTAIEAIKEELKEEKRELKQILKEEFGWFKKDTTLIPNQYNEDDPPGLQFEWEEDKKEEHEENQKEEKKEEKKTFRIEWEDE